MAIGLIDTAVLVDVLRNHPPAVNWLASQQKLGVTRAVYLEVIEGTDDLASQQIALKPLYQFELIEFTVSDFEWATRQLIYFHLTFALDAMDCLIASTSYRLQLPLYTRNLKHFTPLLGKLAQNPY